MSATYVPPLLRPAAALRSVWSGFLGQIARMGHMGFFFIRTMASIPLALKQYRKEVFRLIGDVTWGNGSIVVGGGTVGVVIILSAFGGMTIGLEAYTNLNLLSIGPVTGAISAFGSTREFGPILCALGFAAQAGCRFTAQLGSQRIAEEIDALDAIAIRPLPYLISTRVFAAMVAIIPLYSIGLVVAYMSTSITVGLIGDVSNGTYMHYFHQFLTPTDIIYSFLKAIVFVMLATFIQCYYGFFASGGPEGVGVAAGRAIKATFVIVVVANLLLTLGIWGLDPGIRISG
ncbi:ABC transporter permease [Skermania piniformis]|uniref:ABC transporter permease n=1 Tax=Skermania pinensis TaxID=39122 RepID=A0ABX8S7B2_9ACTN|nr:ABC transporter permease [Skermania piniformis]QXQ13734.1 ABC transporter permease [Skermania piniformis]